MQTDNAIPSSTQPAGKPAHKRSILATAVLSAMISSGVLTLVFGALALWPKEYILQAALEWLILWAMLFLIALPATAIEAAVCRRVYGYQPFVEFTLALLGGLFVGGVIVAVLNLNPGPFYR